MEVGRSAAPGSVVTNPECKDCRAERERRGAARPRYPRPCPYPGPRCFSHHKQSRRVSKAGAHERRVQKEYGLKPGQYGEIYLSQGGTCAICRVATGATRNLSVDHDHRSGYVRGLLCRPCNDLLGQARDNPDFFNRAIFYLNNPPAQALGIWAVHKDFRKEE